MADIPDPAGNQAHCRLGGREQRHGVYLLAYTDMRIGEVLALRWGDVDLS